MGSVREKLEAIAKVFEAGSQWVDAGNGMRVWSAPLRIGELWIPVFTSRYVGEGLARLVSQDDLRAFSGRT